MLRPPGALVVGFLAPAAAAQQRPGAGDARRGPAARAGGEGQDAEAAGAVERVEKLAAPARGRAPVRAPAEPGRRLLSEARQHHAGQRLRGRPRLPPCRAARRPGSTSRPSPPSRRCATGWSRAACACRNWPADAVARRCLRPGGPTTPHEHFYGIGPDSIADRRGVLRRWPTPALAAGVTCTPRPWLSFGGSVERLAPDVRGIDDDPSIERACFPPGEVPGSARQSTFCATRPPPR